MEEDKKGDILKYLKPLTHLIQSLGNPESPRRDWGILMVISITLVVIFVSFSIFLFINITTGTIFTVAPEQGKSATTVNRSDLKDTLVVYRNKKDRYENLLRASPKVVDPSL